MRKLTIVIPVKNPPNLCEFISANRELLTKCKVVVIDSGSGEALKEFADVYIQKIMPLTEARKVGYANVKTEFVMNLDADVAVPKGYVRRAMKLLRKDADAVSIFYEDVNHCQGALEYGCSIWKTEVLKRLYDFTFELVNDGRLYQIGEQKFSTLNNGWCECTYMWRKLKANGLTLKTLPLRATHLRFCECR
jgi:glycosyltransferase involved in cell wall biosynthesis